MQGPMKPGIGPARTPGSSRAVFKMAEFDTYCRCERGISREATALARFVMAFVDAAIEIFQPFTGAPERPTEPRRTERAVAPESL